MFCSSLCDIGPPDPHTPPVRYTCTLSMRHSRICLLYMHLVHASFKDMFAIHAPCPCVIQGYVCYTCTLSMRHSRIYLLYMYLVHASFKDMFAIHAPCPCVIQGYVCYTCTLSMRHSRICLLYMYLVHASYSHSEFQARSFAVSCPRYELSAQSSSA